MNLPENATATDAIDFLTENIMDLVQKVNAGTGMTKAQFVAAFCRAFGEALPVFITNIAAERPELAEKLTAGFLAEQQSREADEQPRRSLSEVLADRRAAAPVVPWPARFKSALKCVYNDAQVAELLSVESIGALSTVLGKRCDETGEEPGDILRQIPLNRLAFALEADAPGAFLANCVRRVPTL